ncbi:MAG: type IIL restriction-modification enzyme MmeI [Pseudoxanthomonas sp.]
MDHIANNEINDAFRLNYARIPLKDSAHILHADALEADWAALLPPEKCSYIMGNPPFVGFVWRTAIQQRQFTSLLNSHGVKASRLDYVAAWFVKAGQYLNGGGSPLPLAGGAGGGPVDNRNTSEPDSSLPPLTPPASGRGTGNKRIRIAFVATNSITQGEQVAQLWPLLFDRYGLEIAFAHRTFSWGSEARGKAQVHVVIVGMAHRDHEPDEKRLFSYPDIKRDPVETRHGALTAYLFDAKGVANRHLVVNRAGQSLAGTPRICVGTKPVDGGHYIFDANERAEFLASEPDAAKAMRPFLGGHEFINAEGRWILHTADLGPDEIRRMTLVKERIAAVREFRTKSGGNLARELSASPTSYHVTVVPKAPFLVIPEVSSERREYVPIGWIKPPAIPSNQLLVIQGAKLWHFGLITSRPMMAWLSHIGGRLESRFRFSSGLVYNTFPWPDASSAQRVVIEALAQAVLDARAAHPTSSLADLYDPDTMPANLRKAHRALDLAVDKLYRPKPFESDRDRVEHLFGRYEALVNPLERLGVSKNQRVARKQAKDPAP